LLLGQDHLDRCVVQDNDHTGEGWSVSSLLVMCKGVRVASPLTSLDHVDKGVRYQLCKVEVALWLVLRLGFEMLVDLSILHKHVEHSMGPLVDASEESGDHSLLSLVSKSQRVDLVVHLHLIFLAPVIVVFIIECLKSQ